MKALNNNRGIALVTSIVLALIALVVVMGILYMVNQGTTISASRKVYKNSVEAAYGGSDVSLYEILPDLLLAGLTAENKTEDERQALVNAGMSDVTTRLNGGLNGISLEFITSASSSNKHKCITDKLTKDPGANWVNWTNCPKNDTNPMNTPDMKFTLKGVSGNYVLYSKIVDTYPGVKYPPGNPFYPPGVAGSGYANDAQHFIYRIEVVGVNESRSDKEQGRLTVVYEY